MLNRRDVLGSLLMAVAAEGMEGGQANAPAPWPNQVFELKHGVTTKETFGELTVFHDGRTGELKSMVSGSVLLNPGQEPHPPHQHPEEEFMLVTEGTGEILVGGQANQVKPGSLMYCEGNAEHGIKNTGSTPFRFYYFKWLA